MAWSRLVVFLGLAACAGALHLAQPGEEGEEAAESLSRDLHSVALFSQESAEEDSPETTEAKNAFLLTYQSYIAGNSSPAVAVAAAVEAQRNYLVQNGGEAIAAQVAAARVQDLANGADKFMARVKTAAEELQRSLDEEEKEGDKVFTARYVAKQEASKQCAYETKQNFLSQRIGKLAAQHLVEKHKAKDAKSNTAPPKPSESDVKQDGNSSFLLTYIAAKNFAAMAPEAAVAVAMEAQRDYLVERGYKDQAKQYDAFLVSAMLKDGAAFLSMVETTANDFATRLSAAEAEGKKVFEAAVIACTPKEDMSALEKSAEIAHETARQWLTSKVGKVAADSIVDRKKHEQGH